MSKTEELDRFTLLAQCLDEIVFVTDLTGRMVWANQQLERRSGCHIACRASR